MVSQSQIDELLTILSTLLEQITPLREQVARLEREFVQVQQEYDKVMRGLNAEAERLEALRQSLRARLARRNLRGGEEERRRGDEKPQNSQDNRPLPPAPTLPLTFEGPLPPLPSEDPRAIRKRALADHIYYFLDSNQQAIMQTINALLVDEWRDVGEMLEVLAWGTIWAARAEWEPLEEQYERLEGWRQALEGRVAFWQMSEQQLKNDSRYALWEERQQRTSREWLVFLDELAERQKESNERLAAEVAVLEEACQERQRSEEREVSA